MTLDELQAKRLKEENEKKGNERIALAQKYRQNPTETYNAPTETERQAFNSIRGAFKAPPIGLEQSIQNRATPAELPMDSYRKPIEDNSYNNNEMDQQRLLMMQ